ncbi:MAG TPA: CBS domain-containing protein [Stellaceae bacterium]|nr:CBS domain-containing protein [Stellaceae bacterium]
MRAMDVMTTKVFTVGPDTTVRELAALLCERAISGAPVVDADGRLVGIVSEGDLLHRAETGTERRTAARRSRWLDGVAVEDLAREYAKAHGRRVRDIMTREVIAVEPETELAEIASLLESNRIKRVPVLRDGKLVGIVSRANLVRALAASKKEASATAEKGDRDIRNRLLEELWSEGWARIWAADVIVRDHVVHLWSTSDQSEAERQALRIAAENIEGVSGVEEHVLPAPMMPAY